MLELLIRKWSVFIGLCLLGIPLSACPDFYDTLVDGPTGGPGKFTPPQRVSSATKYFERYRPEYLPTHPSYKRAVEAVEGKVRHQVEKGIPVTVNDIQRWVDETYTSYVSPKLLQRDRAALTAAIHAWAVTERLDPTYLDSQNRLVIPVKMLAEGSSLGLTPKEVREALTVFDEKDLKFFASMPRWVQRHSDVLQSILNNLGTALKAAGTKDDLSVLLDKLIDESGIVFDRPDQRGLLYITLKNYLRGVRDVSRLDMGKFKTDVERFITLMTAEHIRTQVELDKMPDQESDPSQVDENPEKTAIGLRVERLGLKDLQSHGVDIMASGYPGVYKFLKIPRTHEASDIAADLVGLDTNTGELVIAEIKAAMHKNASDTRHALRQLENTLRYLKYQHRRQGSDTEEPSIRLEIITSPFSGEVRTQYPDFKVRNGKLVDASGQVVKIQGLEVHVRIPKE